LNTGIKEIAKRFNAHVPNAENLLFGEEINGFSYQNCPIIINEDQGNIRDDFSWGLIPQWCKDETIRKNTLNAKIETLDEKPAFRNAVHNRCLVIATGYYEWRWNDEKGKTKQKFEIHSADEEIFAFAGIYSSWNDTSEKIIRNTFSIVTTEANEQMAYIHNNKKRMPVMLRKSDEMAWLNNEIPFRQFSYPNYNADIIAFTV
jgi:putative SOS response-associated peptidase YedK